MSPLLPGLGDINFQPPGPFSHGQLRTKSGSYGQNKWSFIPKIDHSEPGLLWVGGWFRLRVRRSRPLKNAFQKGYPSSKSALCTTTRDLRVNTSSDAALSEIEKISSISLHLEAPGSKAESSHKL